jgi:hypothetical protein
MPFVFRIFTISVRLSQTYCSATRAHVSRFSTLVPVTCWLLIAGCGQEPASVPPVIERVAHARALTDGTYEVRLCYSITSSGGPCLNKDSFKRWTSYTTNWLYLKALEGALTADQVVVTSEAGRRDWPYATTNMRGTVSFTNAAMTVQLERPRYPDGEHLAGYAPYELNATYQMVTDSSPNPQGGANGRQPVTSETNSTSAAAASRRSP